MLERLLGIVYLVLAGGMNANAMVVNFSVDIEENLTGRSGYAQGEFQFVTDGTFNILNGLPDHIVANGSTSLGGFSMRRIDGEAFTILGVTHEGPAMFGGVQLPTTTSFETTTLLPVGPTAVVGVTSVLIDIAPGAVFKLAALTTEVVAPGNPPGVPLPAAVWLFLSALAPLVFARQGLRRQKTTRLG